MGYPEEGQSPLVMFICPCDAIGVVFLAFQLFRVIDPLFGCLLAFRGVDIAFDGNLQMVFISTILLGHMDETMGSIAQV